MTFLTRLLARSGAVTETRQTVIVRLLLDDAGNIQDIRLRYTCGDPQIDARAIQEIRKMRFPASRVGSKTARRWHDLFYDIGSLPEQPEPR